MKRVLFALTLTLAVTGCQAPAAIRRALDVQARYTCIYVEATVPLLRASDLAQREELEGVGLRLIRNADALKEWTDSSKQPRKAAFSKAPPFKAGE